MILLPLTSSPDTLAPQQPRALKMIDFRYSFPPADSLTMPVKLYQYIHYCRHSLHWKFTYEHMQELLWYVAYVPHRRRYAGSHSLLARASNSNSHCWATKMPGTARHTALMIWSHFHYKFPSVSRSERHARNRFIRVRCDDYFLTPPFLISRTLADIWSRLGYFRWWSSLMIIFCDSPVPSPCRLLANAPLLA